MRQSISHHPLPRRHAARAAGLAGTAFRALHRAPTGAARRALRRLLQALPDDRGQAMFFTSVTVFVTLAMSAMAIDTASWYQKHHQSQVAADAASLAAANCLADGAPGRTCTSTTDTTGAIGVAEQIAAANGLPISASQVHFSGTKVSIDVSTTAAPILAQIAGIASAHESASADSSFAPGTTSYTTTVQTTPTTTVVTTTTPTTSTQTTTTPESGSPLALFAMDSNCSDNGVYMQGGSETVNGGVFSNSSLYIDPGGSSYESLNFGTGSGCKVTTEGGGGTYNDGAATAAAVDLTSWPVPYNTSADPLPTCTTTYNGSGTWDIGNQPANTPQVFCYPGGAILLTGYQAYSDDTYICGSFAIQGGGISLQAENYPTNKLLIYATGTGTAANPAYGAAVVKGDIETPNGSINLDSGSNAFTGLLEGLDVNFSGGGSTITGDGPTTYGYVTTTSTTSTTVTTTSTQTTELTTTQTVPDGTTPASDTLVQ
jgi:Flp pilus assembly protein TadG